MVNIYGSEHLWECSPLITFNDERDLIVKLYASTIHEVRANTISGRNIAEDEFNRITDEFINSKIVSIENLKIKGVEITSYKDLLATGMYQELVHWCKLAVAMESILSRDEIKNSQPESDSV